MLQNAPRRIIVLFLLALLPACAARRTADLRPIAEDPVCRYNRDLGCLKVRVDETTPRAVHQGVTYYFCAESCREAFEREPGRYVRG